MIMVTISGPLVCLTKTELLGTTGTLLKSTHVVWPSPWHDVWPLHSYIFSTP